MGPWGQRQRMDRLGLMRCTRQQSPQTAVWPVPLPRRLSDGMQAVRHVGSSGDVGTFRDLLHDHLSDVALIGSMPRDLANRRSIPPSRSTPFSLRPSPDLVDILNGLTVQSADGRAVLLQTCHRGYPITWPGLAVPIATTEGAVPPQSRFSVPPRPRHDTMTAHLCSLALTLGQRFCCQGCLTGHRHRDGCELW
jgi:hypothetical protein